MIFYLRFVGDMYDLGNISSYILLFQINLIIYLLPFKLSDFPTVNYKNVNYEEMMEIFNKELSF